MNTNLVEQRLIEKIRQFSSPRIVEIEGFIDFLYQRESQEQLSIDRTAPTTNEMILLAHSGSSFDFLYDETDLYTLNEALKKLSLSKKCATGNITQTSKGRLEVSTPAPQDQQQVKGSIRKWYRDRALKIFQERYQHCTQMVSFHGIKHESGIELRAMAKRWGSCTSSGKIFLNPLPVSAPNI